MLYDVIFSKNCKNLFASFSSPCTSLMLSFVIVSSLASQALTSLSQYITISLNHWVVAIATKLSFWRWNCANASSFFSSNLSLEALSSSNKSRILIQSTYKVNVGWSYSIWMPSILKTSFFTFLQSILIVLLVL